MSPVIDPKICLPSSFGVATETTLKVTVESFRWYQQKFLLGFADLGFVQTFLQEFILIFYWGFFKGFLYKFKDQSKISKNCSREYFWKFSEMSTLFRFFKEFSNSFSSKRSCEDSIQNSSFKVSSRIPTKMSPGNTPEILLKIPS